MSLMSMTGYGRAEGSHDEHTWIWEVRAVNGKGLDMRLRLPAGFESLDPLIRKTVSKRLARGNLQITLTMQSTNSQDSYAVNEAFLNTLIKTGAKYVKKDMVNQPQMDGLFLVRGVVVETVSSAANPIMKARNKAIIDSLGDMLSALEAARRSEGEALEKILNACVIDFDVQARSARACSAAHAPHIKQKLETQFAELLGDDLPEDKLVHEAALLATKADVREELDRIDAHIASAKSLLASDAPKGRKLDFLSQEFIREINTLCSKSADINLTQTGLEMKSLIEQFREQAANVE